MTQSEHEEATAAFEEELMATSVKIARSGKNIRMANDLIKASEREQRITLMLMENLK